MLAGVDNTSGFGPVMVLGFGGSRVEQLRDVAMECAPLTEADARSMIESLRHGAILDGGVAGAPSYDRDALVRFLVRLSQWAVRFAPAISELDINPVIVREQGVVILDSLLVTRPGGV